MTEKCAGNCGVVLSRSGYDGCWSVMGPYREELSFCSLECMESWLAFSIAAETCP